LPHQPDIRVLAETGDPLTAAGPRVRVAAFAPFLAPEGIGLRLCSSLTPDEYAVIASSSGAIRKAGVAARAAVRLLRRQRDPQEITLVHRLRFPLPIPGLDAAGPPDVYDLDDALFVDSRLGNRRYGTLKQEARRCVTYMRGSGVVVVGNAYLADEARQHNTRVEVVPSCVEPLRQPVRAHEDRPVIVVGWIGSSSTSSYLADILPVFERLNRRGTRLRLVTVGATLDYQAPWLERRRWSLRTEGRDLADFDIGIMPLPDDPWTRGKCGYKLLQYFSAGVPAIASPVGVNMDLIGQDERGMLAKTPADWMAAIECLARDAQARRELGMAARAFVERDFSYQRWAPVLADIVRSVAR